MYYIPLIILINYACSIEMDVEVYFKLNKLLKMKSLHWLPIKALKQLKNLLNVQETKQEHWSNVNTGKEKVLNDKFLKSLRESER